MNDNSGARCVNDATVRVDCTLHPSAVVLHFRFEPMADHLGPVEQLTESRSSADLDRLDAVELGGNLLPSEKHSDGALRLRSE